MCKTSSEGLEKVSGDEERGTRRRRGRSFTLHRATKAAMLTRLKAVKVRMTGGAATQSA